MPLPNSYTQKPGSIAAYFDAILDAQAPDRFSIKFLENLGFTSTNDRLCLGILKELGFLNADGAPQQRYFEFLDRSRSKQILAEAIREAYSDLFAVNKNAQDLNEDDVKNKLRTLYAGKKTDQLIARIAKTFSALCEYADFSKPAYSHSVPTATSISEEGKVQAKQEHHQRSFTPAQEKPRGVVMDSLQYHINIVLPESRDQAVYDAIFKSLKDHLS